MKPVVQTALWAAWGLSPLLLVAWHFGPGQRFLARDIAHTHMVSAREHAEGANWIESAEQWARALEEMPLDDPDRPRVELEHAAARVRAGEVLEGIEQLEALVDLAVESGDAALEASARHELGTSHYFAAWIMRSEGATPEEWREESSRARQQFRLLAERAIENHTSKDESDALAGNLENVIRLEQMDQSELMGLPFPKDCPCNCDGLSQRKREQRLSQGKCKGKKPGDARKEIQQDGAGAARRTGAGS